MPMLSSSKLHVLRLMAVSWLWMLAGLSLTSASCVGQQRVCVLCSVAAKRTWLRAWCLCNVTRVRSRMPPRVAGRETARHSTRMCQAPRGTRSSRRSITIVSSTAITAECADKVVRGSGVLRRCSSSHLRACEHDDGKRGGQISPSICDLVVLARAKWLMWSLCLCFWTPRPVAGEQKPVSVHPAISIWTCFLYNLP